MKSHNESVKYFLYIPFNAFIDILYHVNKLKIFFIMKYRKYYYVFGVVNLYFTFYSLHIPNTQSG